VLKWFSFLLRVTCVISARAINTDALQAMLARATESQKTVVTSMTLMLCFKNKIYEETGQMFVNNDLGKVIE